MFPSPNSTNSRPRSKLPSRQLHESTPHIEAPEPQLHESTPHTEAPEPQLHESTPHTEEPEPQLHESTPHTEEPEPQLHESTPHTEEPEPQLHESTPHTEEPEPQLHESTPHTEEPEPQLHESTPHTEEPEPQLHESTPHTEEPEPQLHESTPHTEEPSAGPIPVDDWLEQVFTITSDIEVQPQTAGDTTTMTAVDEAVVDHDRESAQEHVEAAESSDAEAPESSVAGEVVAEADSSVDDEPALEGRPEGYHPDVDDVRDGEVIVGLTPGASANDDYLMASSPAGGGAGRSRHGRPSVIWALALALVLILLGGGAGYGIALYLPDKWTAEAEVVLDPGTQTPDSHLATQQVLMESSVILDRAVGELPVDRDYVENELKVFPIEASTALGINFVDSDPELARDVVAAVLGSFMTEVDVVTADFSTPIYLQRIEDLTAERQELERGLRDLEAANAQAEANEEPLPYPAEVRRMALESEQLLAQISTLNDAVLTAEVATLERTDATVVTEPRILSDPTWPNPLVFTALGLLVGLVVAAIVLFLLASRRVTKDPIKEH